jgi:SAM-dependent methyltransferase
MNEILKSQDQIDAATDWLKKRDCIGRPDCLPKNWDIHQIIPFFENGDMLELGCFSSVAIDNAIQLGIRGRKCGVDLQPSPQFKGEFFQGNLLTPPFDDNSFDTILCLSVIEHGIDLEKFFATVFRLLRKDGQLLLTFDYWNPLVNNFGTDTQPFCAADVRNMIHIAQQNQFRTERMDYEQRDPVIYWGNHSPHPGLRYTFGSIRFAK